MKTFLTPKISLFTVLLISCVIHLSAISSDTTKSDVAPEATVVELETQIAATTFAEATLAFLDLPVLENVFINTSPTDRKDGLVGGKLGVDGGNNKMLVELAQEIAEGHHGEFDSLLIAHKGKLLFESYYSRGRINLPHFQKSATKVYTSLALGRAIQLGYLTMADLDQPLVRFLKDLDPSKFVAGVEKITLHQVMTMQSGIRISQEQREEFMSHPTQLKGQGLVQAYFQNSAPITSESQRFLYQNDPMLVMQVLDAVVPGSAEEFIKNELLNKMGIMTYRWETDVSGLPKSTSGSYMTSRDMVKWGLLAMNKGRWNGEQLIPEVFITKATHRIVHHSDDENFAADDSITNTGYGYFWWQADMKYGDKNFFSTSARGGGGQYIILIEALDLIVVATANDRDDKTLKIVAERIIAAFVQDKPPVLEGPYLGQKPPGLIPEPFAPGVVNTAYRELGPFFSPDLKELYLVREGGKHEKFTLVVFQRKNNQWHESTVMPRIGRPIISTDGQIMHLGKQYMERTESGWSEVKGLDSSFGDIRVMRLSSSSKGTYVFDEVGSRDGDGVIRYSRLIDGKREAPRAFGKEINTGKFNAHPFIAPDESYLIWDGERTSGYGEGDLYISFRRSDGSWGGAINMGQNINTKASEGGAFVTSDGKYFFFTRNMNPDNYKNVDVFWVDAQFIKDLRLSD